MGEVSPEFVDNIPGKDGDRKSPRGELSWIFTTVTDTIAWSTLPLPTFQKLFRQDLLVASLFRNFLLAKRVMKSLNCTPQSWPPLPDSTTHHLWQAWDLAAESCVLAAYTSYKGTSMIDPRNNMSILPAFASSASTTFFSDHLTAFEVWLDFEASQSTLSLSTPTYLPVLLQMLLSPAHRLRALQLLRRYMSLGSHTVNLTLLVGIFPYVLKLLQNQSPDIRQVLLCIWTSIVGFDRSCRMELIRDKCQNYFVQYLLAKDLSSSHRCMAAFTLAEICNGTQEGRHSCFVLNLHSICCAIVASEDLTQLPDFKKWICLCLSKLFEDFAALKFKMLTELNSKMFIPFLLDAEPSVRAATVLMLSQLFGAFLHQSQSQPQSQQQQFQNASIGNFGNQPSVGINLSDPTVQEVVEEEVRLVLELLRSCTDGSVMVRREAIIALSKFIFQPFYKECFKMISRSIRKHMHPKRSIEGLSFLYTFGSGHPSHSFYGLYYQVYPWNLSNIDYDAVAEDLIIYFDEIGFTKTSALSAPVTARADVDANANDWTVGSAKSLTPFALATTDTRDIVVAAIYMLRSPSGESLSCADASSGVATPAVSSKHIDLQTKAPRVVDFLRIWFTLQEVFCSDPHPTVRASAAAVTKQISAEIDDEDMLLADSLRASSHDKSSSHQDLTNLPNQDVSSSFDSNLSADDARINILQQRSLMHKSSSDSVLTNKVANMYKLTHPMLAPQLGDNMSFRRSPSPLAPAPFASRPMPYGSGLNPSEGMAGIGNFGPNLNTGVISNNNSGSGGAGGGGQRSGGMMSSASPPIQPRQGSFCSYSVDGGGTDSSLVSFLYEWQCKLFLVPDCGFDPFDDPMSIEGQARIYRYEFVYK